MSNKTSALRRNYYNAAKVKAYGEEVLYPNFKSYKQGLIQNVKALFKSLGINAPDKSDEALFKEHAETQTEQEFENYKAQLIDKLIEHPCTPLAKELMKSGYQTIWSNGYGDGFKGVFWTNSNIPEQIFFTSLLNGHTYEAEIDNASKRPFIKSNIPIKEGEPDVTFTLPEGYNLNIHLS